MHHGATYIHTKNKAGDTLQHHGSGKTSVMDVQGHGPRAGCGLPCPPAPPPAPALCGAGLRAGGRGRRDACHEYWGTGGQWWQEKQAPLSPTPVAVSSRTAGPSWGRRKGCSALPVSPPAPAWVPGSFWGGPTAVPMVWGALECLGNQGRLGLRTGVGWRAGGAHRPHGGRRGAWWWGQGLGGQLGS